MPSWRPTLTAYAAAFALMLSAHPSLSVELALSVNGKQTLIPNQPLAAKSNQVDLKLLLSQSNAATSKDELCLAKCGAGWGSAIMGCGLVAFFTFGAAAAACAAPVIGLKHCVAGCPDNSN